MKRCHDGASICLQCLVSCESPFFLAFQGCLYKKPRNECNGRAEDCYQKWEKHLHRCVVAQGNYFEGDNIDI
jgi:hypothetical protein